MDYLLKQGEPRLDPSRLYVTGHSMGGSGALVAAAALKYFAAAVPVAAAGAPSPESLRHMPVWAFHGSNDGVVPSHISEQLIAGLRSAGIGEDQARLTLYDDAPTPPGWPHSVGHAATIPAYATKELYEWLLRQKRVGHAAGEL
eukprot:TRINITY_DN16448_c0_g1_i3.p2 TRINITY_DN16448_c0_g1~~TRINITY_DN16448_c0_g1_i3.p2  ORF type:complete len:144 (-),score=15.14 TRINITY_DN16448_c0_g1_i3:475-906(-)